MSDCTLVDWKRVEGKALRMGAPTAKSPFGTGDLAGYALQLNLYKAILEREYGAKVTKMLVVQIDPEAGEVTELPVPELGALGPLLARREAEVERARASAARIFARLLSIL